MIKELEIKQNYLSKKARQIALEEKINQIDQELAKIGVLDMKYKVPHAISNPETSQNTIFIGQTIDLSFLIRILAYYKNIQDVKKLIEK